MKDSMFYFVKSVMWSTINTPDYRIFYEFHSTKIWKLKKLHMFWSNYPLLCIKF